VAEEVAIQLLKQADRRRYRKPDQEVQLHEAPVAGQRLVQVGEQRRQRRAGQVEGRPIAQVRLDLGQDLGGPDLAQATHGGVQLLLGPPSLDFPVLR
jgi:hypothetical protein